MIFYACNFLLQNSIYIIINKNDAINKAIAELKYIQSGIRPPPVYNIFFWFLYSLGYSPVCALNTRLK